MARLTHSSRPVAGTFLLAGTVLASLTEALAGTIPTLARDDIMGSTHATPDEFAWLDFGYVTLKLLGFLIAPWLLTHFSTRMLVIIATLAMGVASSIATCTVRLELLVAVRMIQGLSGGVLLVAGQTALFLVFPKKQQPIVQAVFAMGAIVAPATAALTLEGWLLDLLSWTWIFFSIVPLSLAAAGLLLVADDPPASLAPVRPFDWVGAMLISVALFCVSYVLSRGSRWDWLEEPHILWLTVLGGASFLFVLGRHAFGNGRRLFDAAPFCVESFSFAFAVSFVAGAGLSGSAFLIPLFSRSSLALTYLETGKLLLPSGALFRVVAPSRLHDTGAAGASDRHNTDWYPDDHDGHVDALRHHECERPR
jgi:DHA2 family multidrug resistance protein